jgi:hypothetical protein
MADREKLCRGDYVNGVEDLFRFLRRGREYLIEADRQLRQGGSEEERAASAAWYVEMDAHDEWTGSTAEAHAACVHDIILFFEENAEFVAQYEGLPHMLRRYDDQGNIVGIEWCRLEVAPEIEELRKSALAIEARIAAQSKRQ